MLPQSQNAIDLFIDALWLEDGLSRNTLAAYRRDLSLYAQWLAAQELLRKDFINKRLLERDRQAGAEEEEPAQADA